MTKIKNVVAFFEEWAPLNYQEDYDNAGLILGNESWEVNSILISLDVTESVVKEAIEKKANLIIAHHPIIFKGLKRLNGNNYVERTVMLAIKNDIAIYASHTNLDHVKTGVNLKIAEKIGINNIKILCPKKQTLLKLSTFVPPENHQKVLEALHLAGAGNIGNYEKCSFTTVGTGTFKPKVGAKPTIGTLGKLEELNENKIEVILPEHLQSKILKTLELTHPYEEVAYYITKLENKNQEVGAGAIGELAAEMDELSFLKYLKVSMNLGAIKHTAFLNKKIKKVAICGGAGSFLLKDAISSGADAFVTADYKYHEFFDADNQILIIDIGHYESEVFTKELIHFQLSNKFTNFASLLSETQTNPVKYFY